MNYNDQLNPGFFTFADDSNGYNAYLAACCIVGRVAIGLAACYPGGVVLVSTMPLGGDWPRTFLTEVGFLAREQGALDGSIIDQFSIIEFESVETAKRFAFALVDRLKDCELFEYPPRLPCTAIQSVLCLQNYSNKTEH